MKQTTRISPLAIAALKDALGAGFWFKNDLRAFLRSALSDQGALEGIDWQGNYKRVSVNQVIERMAADRDRYGDQLIQLMLDVSQMDDFPQLRRAEDSDLKISEAREAVAHLRKYTKPFEEALLEQAAKAEEIKEAKRASQEQRAIAEQLEQLKQRFYELHAGDVPHARGLALEALLRDLFKLFDLDPKASFRIEGEQIDGAFTLDTTHFLLEAKWRKQPSDRADLDAFDSKVRVKIENTLGLFISIEGFQRSAVEKHSGKGAAMILMDGGDLLAVLEGRIDLVELLHRKHRHAAQTGNILLPVSEIVTGS